MGWIVFWCSLHPHLLEGKDLNSAKGHSQSQSHSQRPLWVTSEARSSQEFEPPLWEEKLSARFPVPNQILSSGEYTEPFCPGFSQAEQFWIAQAGDDRGFLGWPELQGKLLRASATHRCVSTLTHSSFTWTSSGSEKPRVPSWARHFQICSSWHNPHFKWWHHQRPRCPRKKPVSHPKFFVVLRLLGIHH